MRYFLILLAAMGLLTGCYYDKAQKLYAGQQRNDTCTTSPTYTATIQPIMAQSCAIGGCHDANSTNGFFLDNYEHVKGLGLNGEIVGAVTHAANYSPMPQNLPSLSTCQISEIKAWVNAGAPQ